jgi:hypothetical protein
MFCFCFDGGGLADILVFLHFTSITSSSSSSSLSNDDCKLLVLLDLLTPLLLLSLIFKLDIDDIMLVSLGEALVVVLRVAVGLL